MSFFITQLVGQRLLSALAPPLRVRTATQVPPQSNKKGERQQQRIFLHTRCMRSGPGL